MISSDDIQVVNLSDLNVFDEGSIVDGPALAEKGLIPDMKLPVKILGTGEITKKLTITAGWYSKTAHEKIVAAGGTAQNVKGETFEFPKPKKKFIPREAVKKVKPADVEAAAPVTEGAAPATASPADESEKPA